MEEAGRIDIRWVDEPTFARVQGAFARSDVAAVEELVSLSLERLPFVAAEGPPKVQEEWHRGTRAVFENFLEGPSATRKSMMGEWGDQTRDHLALCLALPSFLPVYLLEQKVMRRYVPLTELYSKSSEWHHAMNSAELAMQGESVPWDPALECSDFRIAWPAEPSLVTLGRFDGRLWEDVAARKLGTVLHRNADLFNRLLGAQAKVLDASELLALERFAAEHQSLHGVQGEVATALERLVTGAKAHGFGVLSLARSY